MLTGMRGLMWTAVVEMAPRAFVHGLAFDDAKCIARLPARIDIFRNTQGADEAPLLEYHGDAGVRRATFAKLEDRHSVNLDRSRFRLIHAGYKVHER